MSLVILKIIDEIRLIHIALVADTDNLVHADKVVIERFHDQNGNAAALDNVGNIARGLEYPAHFDQAWVDAVETAEFFTGVQCP